MKIEKVEDIQAWQKARELTKMIYSFTRKGEFRDDHGLRDQIQRAAVSVMANVAEGFGAESNSEFIQFLSYARRSSSEVASHLYVAFDQSYISRDEFIEALKIASEARSLIQGFVRYLKEAKTRNLELGTRNQNALG